MLLAIDLMSQVLEAAMPFAIVFALTQRMVDIYLSAAFGGHLKI